MKHEENLKQVNTMQGAISEQLKDVMTKAEEFKALLTKPLETKTVNINGSSCVVQMFSDKVTVILPSKQAVLDYYKNINIKKECWYKKYFKWSK